MSHEQSPLTLLNHRFISFSCHASNEDKAEGALALNTEQHIAQHSEDNSQWKVQLEVKFHAVDEASPSPYAGEIKIEGHFRVREDFDPERREELMRVTASSILYGACREMLANFTARSTLGMLSLPSVSFRNVKTVTNNTSDKS